MLDCLVNGEISMHIPVTDRGLNYGDGVFETLAVFKGVPRFWQLHMDRLANACEVLGLPACPQKILLREAQTVSAGRGDCVVKIMLTRGSGGRGYSPHGSGEPNRIVAAFPLPLDVQQVCSNVIRARMCNLRLGLQPALAGIKHLNRLEQVMARAEWTDESIFEGILLDEEDHVISATAGNIFLVSGGRFLTPRMDRCGVRGVMRSAILKAFQPRCEQRRIMLDMLPEADEVFICNAVRGVIPVNRIDHWEFQAGPATREVQSWLNSQ